VIDRAAGVRTPRVGRVILLLADGDSYATITAKTGCSSRTIALWKHRFEASGLDGLLARHRGSKRTVLTPALLFVYPIGGTLA
jgi:transposase